MEGSHELESFNVNIVNGFNAFVSYIDIIVHTVDPFIISNLRLPLRECIENIKETVSFKNNILVLILIFSSCNIVCTYLNKL